MKHAALRKNAEPAPPPQAIAQGRFINDKSPGALAQRKRMDLLATNAQSTTQQHNTALQRVDTEEPLQAQMTITQRVEDEGMLQGQFDTTQRAEDEELLQGKNKTAQLATEEEPLQAKFTQAVSTSLTQQADTKPNNTGLPSQLKSGIESLSSVRMDDVKVHYNSEKPAQLNAHAYAQGSDIHVAPGQEQHLPHEAWHVVQQAQGRVKPTMQMKGNTPVNDDVALENEADLMGAKAVVQGAAIGVAGKPHASVPSPTSPVQLSVIQRRLPTMTEENIAAEPRVAAELLVHSLRNLKGSSLTTYFAQDAEPAAESRDRWITYLQGEPSLEQIGILSASMANAVTVPAYAMEPDIQTELAVEVQTQIGLQLASISANLGTAIGNTVMLKSIMGVEDDQVGIAVNVLNLTKAAIDLHISNATCPVVIGGNKEHNLWAGVGAMTRQGAAQMELSQSTANALAAGSASGKASLVHEFTHAAANTEDHAYTTEACYALKPPQRLANATTYEHAFLEIISGTDRTHHYNPDHEVQAANGHELNPVSAARLNAARRASQLASKVWNNVDNAYIQARQIAGGEARTQVRLGLSALATYPYTPMGSPATYAMGLALIEDRTKMLIALKKAPGHKPVLTPYQDTDTLNNLMAYEVLAKSIARLGIMSEHDAMEWAIWLEKLPAIESFLKEKRATYM